MNSTLMFIFLFIAQIETMSFPPVSNEEDIEIMSGIKVGTIQSSLIPEASGIVASRKNNSVLWVHNDSGNSEKIFALNPSGKLIGIFTLKGSHCRDWEDIALGPGPEKNYDYLYIGDIGDNNAKYPSVIIYRVKEPYIDPNSTGKEIAIGPAEKIELIYPDGPKDSETLLVDPLNGDIYIISKRNFFSRVYLTKYPQSTSKPTRMDLVTILPWGLATGGDVSTDGGFVIIRGQAYASIWRRPEGEPLWHAFSGKYSTIELIPEPQGEAVCFSPKSLGFFTVSEKTHQPIYYYEGKISMKNSSK